MWCFDTFFPLGQQKIDISKSSTCSRLEVLMCHRALAGLIWRFSIKGEFFSINSCFKLALCKSWCGVLRTYQIIIQHIWLSLCILISWKKITKPQISCGPLRWCTCQVNSVTHGVKPLTHWKLPNGLRLASCHRFLGWRFHEFEWKGGEIYSKTPTWSKTWWPVLMQWIHRVDSCLFGCFLLPVQQYHAMPPKPQWKKGVSKLLRFQNTWNWNQTFTILHGF